MKNQSSLSQAQRKEIDVLMKKLNELKTPIKANAEESITFQSCLFSLENIFSAPQEQKKISEVKLIQDFLKGVLSSTSIENKNSLEVEFDENLNSSQNIRSLKEHFRQSQKMEALGRMTGGIAHDFNNFLTVILSYGRMILEDLEKESPHRPALSTIVECAERAALLTQQLLAFSRQQVIEPKIIDMNALIKNMQTLIKRVLGEVCELLVISDDKLEPIEIDQSQLQQIIMNLAVNARDAMPRGGKLILETNNVTLKEGQIRGLSGEYSVLSVSDNGTGMSDEVKARIFEPFFTTKEIGKGTGLGLSTVFGIVKQNNGFLDVLSEVNQGTTFKIYFPSVKKTHATIIPPLSPIDDQGGEGSILVVEDEESVRVVATTILQRAGYEVIAVADSEEALHMMAALKKPLDLLLSDVIMPKMHGPELAKKLCGFQPGLKVLFMSGYTDDALDPGLQFIQKPFTKTELLSKIKGLLD